MSNCFGSPFSGFEIRGVAFRVKFGMKRLYTSHMSNNDFNSVMGFTRFKPRMASVVYDASSNLPERMTCPKLSIFSVEN